MIEATEGAGHRHTALKGGNVQGAPTVGGGVGGKLVGVAGLKAVDLVLRWRPRCQEAITWAGMVTLWKE